MNVQIMWNVDKLAWCNPIANIGVVCNASKNDLKFIFFFEKKKKKKKKIHHASISPIP
jgi:hypothetical protein